MKKLSEVVQLACAPGETCTIEGAVTGYMIVIYEGQKWHLVKYTITRSITHANEYDGVAILFKDGDTVLVDADDVKVLDMDNPIERVLYGRK